MEYERIQVTCRRGYKVNEYPLSFEFRKSRWEIMEILDRWYEGGREPERPVMDYYKVKTRQGSIFILIYAAHLDEWFIRY